MKTTKAMPNNLVKGQIYKLSESHIEIVEIGKRLVHFKRFKMISKGSPIIIRPLVDVQDILKNNGATLMKPEKPKRGSQSSTK
jgi:hypothetical protein